MAETFSRLSTISFVAAGVCLAIAVVLWIVFRIPGVIGDLSGRNAKKSIARMRQSNERSGSKSYRSSETNAARGKLTATMPGAGAAEKPVQQTHPAPQADEAPETVLLSENRADRWEESTVLLSESGETELLAETPKEPARRMGGVPLTMLEEVMLIHTDEAID